MKATDNPFEWWDSLDNITKTELKEQYCDHWETVDDVTDNDIIVMFDGENPREEKLTPITKDFIENLDLEIKITELQTENQQLREALENLLSTINEQVTEEHWDNESFVESVEAAEEVLNSAGK